ncbi:MAG: hypothetical protein KC469_08035 [Flavobacteriaceae bacterium]|nr:hypothetical protein [Flavobacteriaceae bacterium]
MLKLFSISLSLLFLMQSLGLHPDDIAQIDEFIEHSKFHNEEYGDDVFAFISKHYGDLKVEHEIEHQEEKEEHEELPFKHQSQPLSTTALELDLLNLEIKTTDFLELTINNFYYQLPSSTLHSDGILQPPRHS